MVTFNSFMVTGQRFKLRNTWIQQYSPIKSTLHSHCQLQFQFSASGSRTLISNVTFIQVVASFRLHSPNLYRIFSSNNFSVIHDASFYPSQFFSASKSTARQPTTKDKTVRDKPLVNLLLYNSLNTHSVKFINLANWVGRLRQVLQRWWCSNFLCWISTQYFLNEWWNVTCCLSKENDEGMLHENVVLWTVTEIPLKAAKAED